MQKAMTSSLRGSSKENYQDLCSLITSFNRTFRTRNTDRFLSTGPSIHFSSRILEWNKLNVNMQNYET